MRSTRHLLIFFILVFCGCSAEWTTFQEYEFEDCWWKPEDYDWCFNFHTTITGENELLLFEDDKIKLQGTWTFEEPNVYYVDDYTVHVWQDGECWDIGTSIGSIYACECPTR